MICHRSHNQVMHYRFIQTCLQCRNPGIYRTPLCSNCRLELTTLATGCPRCNLPMTNGDLCGHCLQNTVMYDATYAAFDYQGLIKSMINKLKFNQQYYQAVWLSDLWLEHFKQRSFTVDVIIPVPLHRKRLRQRGYNQAALIAKQLAKRLQIAVNIRHVQRTHYSQPQSSLSAKQRHKIRSSYFNCQLKGIKRAAIVDDVMTTGSTLNALATCLKRQGVEHVENWIIARTLKR